MIHSPLWYDKIKTNVPGLDRLLYGGLSLSPRRNVIVVRGSDVQERTVLCAQIAYGICQSLKTLVSEITSREGTVPKNLPRHDNVLLLTMADAGVRRLLEEQLLGLTISRGIRSITDRYVSERNFADIVRRNLLSMAFFQREEYGAVSPELAHSPNPSTDEEICKEFVYYSNRTSSLHCRTSRPGPDDENESAYDNALYFCRFETLHEFCTKTLQSDIAELEKYVKFPIVDMEVSCYNATQLKLAAQGKLSTDVLVIDTTGLHHRAALSRANALVSALCDARPSVVTVVGVPAHTYVPEDWADVIVDMGTAMIDHYVQRRLTLSKCWRQQHTIGWHLYKLHDYGIEVYPSIHTYFQKRRYLQRTSVYTHSDVVTDTYQQYLDKFNAEGAALGPADYRVYVSSEPDKYLEALRPHFDTGFNSVDVLERILLPETSHDKTVRLYSSAHDNSTLALGHGSGMTAIVGEANTYKRYLTYGSIFSSARHRRHTLLLLFNRQPERMRRRLYCPARDRVDSECGDCKQCYKYIHFMNIVMGNISADELVASIVRQLDLQYTDGGKVSRVVIDDMQIIDFCFPLLHRHQMFLAALATICQERGINIYVMSDKSATATPMLRAIADNVIVTGRDATTGDLRIYIERFAGYTNSPSRIYCGHVRHIEALFECYSKIDDRDHMVPYYALNNMEIEDGTVSTMADYW